MSDFKKYVLDRAVGEINEHSDLLVGYDQIKDGRTITGFCFKFEIKKQSVNKQNNIDNKALLIENLSDKQIARITHSKKFISDYSNMVNPQSPANQSSNSWIEEMSKRLITHPGDFIKRPLQEYLDDEQANRFQ